MHACIQLPHNQQNATHLLGDDKVGKHGHGGAVRDKVGHRLHDVPGVLPPREPGKEPKLQRHEGHAAPDDCVGAPLGALSERLLLCLQRRELRAKLLQLSAQLHFLAQLSGRGGGERRLSEQTLHAIGYMYILLTV